MAAPRVKIDERFKQLERLQVTMVRVADLNPNSYNPNRQKDTDFEMLKRSITEDGFTQPVLINEDMTIVDGEHRWRAARDLGMVEIPAVVVSFTKEQMRLSTLRHNRARGHEDIALTDALLRDLEKMGALAQAQHSLNLSDSELARALNDLPVPDLLAGSDFSEAWEPVAGDEANSQGEITENRLVGTSTATAQKVEAMRQEVAAIEDPAQRQVAQKELQKSLVRINVVYSGDDAALVRGVLVRNDVTPADRLLNLCRKVVV